MRSADRHSAIGENRVVPGGDFVNNGIRDTPQILPMLAAATPGIRSNLSSRIARTQTTRALSNEHGEESIRHLAPRRK